VLENYEIYKDIAERAGGDVYIGVVGPVRAGTSTFIKRFMDLLVIPNIENAYSKERARDELPQSGAGRAIMTAEPKFVPNEAAEVKLDDNLSFRARLIDCVGYLVPGATGHMDGEGPRMVSTPWSEDKIPFSEAAEIGTRKVIQEHSTIGVVITTDGSVTDIPREDYAEAETRVIGELKAIGKPFVIVVNTSRPYTPEAEELKKELAEKHNAAVLAVNCAQIKPEDITNILEKVLYEFPVSEIRVNIPKWVEALPVTHWIKKSLIQSVKEAAKSADKLREVKNAACALSQNEHIKKAYVDKISLGDGGADIELSVLDQLFYQVLSETTGMSIGGEHQLISIIKVLSEAKREYDKVKFALEEVRHRGYGVVTPSTDEMTLDAPQLVRHGSRYGVKIRASAPSLHIIQANIETEISPIVGTQKQSEDLIEYFNGEMAENPGKIWELNMFGKSMHDMVREGLAAKLHRMPDDAQSKMQEALQKIINEGNGGLICILL
jgi:stage IV sporulation protein A